MSEAFFFGADDRQLFATYHPPAAIDGRTLTVICAPLFGEYMRTQLALRELAIALAGRGQHVLRFDYLGTGDSFGDLAEVTVSDWLEDVVLAVREGRDLSGSTRLQILGVRAGALLACGSTACAEAQRVVLWDPVLDGTQYLQALRRVEAAIFERNPYLSQAERNAASDEHGGYFLSQRMLEEFRPLDAQLYSRVSPDKLHVVSTAAEPGFPIAGVKAEVAQFACDWETPTEDQILPQPVLERLAACLTLS